MKEHTRVAIIGAGASGLAQIKQLLDVFNRPDVRDRTSLEVVAFEKNAEVGGVWFADEREKRQHISSTLPSTSTTDVQQLYQYPPANADPSPMYDGLRTNLPHDLMAYRDLPMPSTLPTFPSRAQIQAYLESYADAFDLRRHIRFDTAVTRLYKTTDTVRPWRVQWAGRGQSGEEAFDFVCCANGHYADGWIPEIPGLDTFNGDIIHSRYFRSAEDFAGKTVLVVGSFASGGDISRLLAAYNLRAHLSTSNEHAESAASGLPTPPSSAAPSPPSTALDGADSPPSAEQINVHVSCSQQTAFSVKADDPSQPWGRFVRYHPLISHIAPGESSANSAHSPAEHSARDSAASSSIHFDDGSSLTGVDVIIFATGHNFALPFAKQGDAPWRDTAILDGVVRDGERRGGNAWEEGGLKGLGVKGLDELMLFLENDRSICFPTLQYQIVPFPMAETQTRLSALLWAGLLPSFPDHPRLPPNFSNPYSTPPATPSPSSGTATPAAISFNESRAHTPDPRSAADKPVRKVVQTRQKLVFGAPYEWVYQEYLFQLMAEARRDGEPEYWTRIEEFRRARRADTTLRKRELGY